MFTAVVLVLLGGAIARGLLAPLQVRDVVLAVLLVAVVRPVIGWVSLLGGPAGPVDRRVVAFFGVRGIGSVFYLADALGHARFPDGERLWAVTGLVILLSVGVERHPGNGPHRPGPPAVALGREADPQQVPV